jgi:hypothetical protein
VRCGWPLSPKWECVGIQEAVYSSQWPVQIEGKNPMHAFLLLVELAKLSRVAVIKIGPN